MNWVIMCIQIMSNFGFFWWGYTKKERDIRKAVKDIEGLDWADAKSITVVKDGETVSFERVKDAK